MLDPRIPGDGRTLVRLYEITDLAFGSKSCQVFMAAVGAAIIDDDYFERLIGLPEQTIQRVLEQLDSVMRWYDNRKHSFVLHHYEFCGTLSRMQMY